MADEKVTIQITLDKEDFQRSLKDLEKDTEKAGDKIGTGFSRGFFKAGRAIRNAFSNVFGRLRKEIFSIKGLLTGAFVGFFTREAVREANSLEQALVGLKSVTSAFGGDLNRIESEAKSLASDGLIPLTDVSDSLKNLIGTFDGDINKAVKAFKVLRDSASFNRQGQLSLGEAIRGASEGLRQDISNKVDNAGVTKNLSVLLKEYAQSINKSVAELTQAERAQAKYVGLLKEGIIFQGDYNKLLNTFSGATSSVSGAYSTILASLGETITKSPIVVRTIRALGQIFNVLGVEIEKIDRKNIIGNIITQAVTFAKQITLKVLGPLGNIPLIFNKVRNKFIDFIAGFIKDLAFLGDKIVKFLDKFKIAPDINFTEIAEQGLEILNTKLDETQKGLDDTFGEGAKTKVTEFYDNLIANIQRANAPLDTTGNKTKEVGVKFTSTADQITASSRAIGQTVSQAIAQTATKGIQSLTKSLILGQKGFDNFGKAIAGILGDLSTQLGQTLILTGIGIESIGNLSGTKAIIAGAGLVALGTILKSFSGGAGGSSTTTSGEAISGGGQSTFIQDEPEEREGPSTEVTVNISGDVLDSEQTGSRIVDILNEAYDKQGVVINRGIIG